MSQSPGERGPDQPPDQSQASDELLEVYRRTGRPEDFERVVGRFAALVMTECRRVTRDAHDAEDAAQLAFLALAMELKAGTTIKRPAGWLQRVAKRQALKIVRSRGRRKRREDAARKAEVSHESPTPAEAAPALQTGELIREAIDALPEKHRLPLVLHYFGGMTLEAIASEMGLTRTAVGTRLHRARKILGDTLGERGITFNAGELGAIVALLVPTAVVASIARSSMVATGASVNSVALAKSVSHILAASGTALGARPIAAMAAVCALAATGAAWVAPKAFLPALRERFNLIHWLERIVGPPSAPQIRFAELAPEKAPEHLERSALGNPFASYTQSTGAPFDTDFSTTLGAFSSADTMPVRSSGVSIAPPQTTRRATDSNDFNLKPTLLSFSPSATFVASDLTDDRPLPPSVAAATPAIDRARAPSLRIGNRDGESVAIDARSSRSFSAITLGEASGDRGTLVQAGGFVSAGHLVVGDRGTGFYDLRGGTLEAGSLTIAARPHSRGTVHIGDAELDVTDPTKPIEVGAAGSGRLLLGTQDAPGSLTTATGADIPLIVRATASAQGLVQGWGDVRTTGTLVNNGRVVADGFDHLRALNLTQASSVINAIDNAPGGTNGWYARRGGRVELPAIHVMPGTHTYTWGESADDPTLDLVNSVRITAHDQPGEANLSISLRTIALADPLDVPLPSGIAVFGLWETSGVGVDPSKLDVEIRYDHVSAQGLFPGEFATRLLGYEDGAWTLAGGEHLDVADHLIAGSFDGAAKYLAVGIFWEDPFRTSLAGQLEPYAWASAFQAQAFVPEPTAVFVVASGIGVSSLCRRRRGG